MTRPKRSGSLTDKRLQSRNEIPTQGFQHHVQPSDNLDITWDASPLVGFDNFDRYDRGAANAHVRFRVSGRSGSKQNEVADLCAIVGQPEADPRRRRRRLRQARDSLKTEGGYDIAQFGRQEDELPVLVCVFESAEEGENIPGRSFWTTPIGLHRLDDCYSLGGHALDGGTETAPPFRIASFRERIFESYRKAGMAAASGRDEANREVVKRRPGIVKNVAEDDSAHWFQLPRDLESVAPAVASRMLFAFWPPYDPDRLIWVAFFVPLDLELQLLEVLLRPVELEPPGLLAR